ncbi:serine/threonine protein kinase [Microtetraspora sp. AC03309]|uniref:serine/threonine-protein kinase n=1 Tax=Microtetraspora sp. AC03309 TaxID=2779376 RepID=UPI001E5D25FB|nr:serine/threonine-protein kinase [Microtetraspora sp. AC03309]MCC5577910.1 serine/threonine protein kinase [Microtetraspora sp. AC03309]
MGGRLGRVGPYALLERLGRGGMGEVYLAANRRGEQVAVKMLRDPLGDDPDARLRLEREVRALRRVESPYVAQVLDADLSGDRPYLVMEHIEGETLLDAVRRAGPLAECDLISLAQGLATALAITHAAGVVHRDLKPANVLMGVDGPVLIDFGIAQVLDATRLTMTGTFLGTPGYAAPELFADETVGQPADVHAWAATVAFAATGRPTFGRGTVQSQMYAILHGQADLAGVPAALLPLIRAALHRDPSRRPTAAVLADRLARLARASAEPAFTSGGRRRAAPEEPEETHDGSRARIRDRSADKAAEGARDRSPAIPAEARRRGRRTVRRPGSALAAEAAAASTPGLPTGSAALLVLALLAIPCVVASLVFPLATFAITGTLAVLIRALWSGHWLVRKRESPRVRGVLRVLTFPLTLAGSLVSAVAWPGLPAAAAAFAALWLTAGARLEPEWWTQAVPVTVAGIAFGVVTGGIIGREVERVGARVPELRREGLRALAVLGGFVALCAAAVRAVAFFV